MKSVLEYQDPHLGIIKVRKVARSRRLRIRPYSDHILVTIPRWVAFQAGKEFALSQSTWINQHRPEPENSYMTGDRIGKQHVLEFIPHPDITKPRSRISGKRVRVEYPAQLSAASTAAQNEAKKAIIRTLRKEAELYLPHRVSTLARQFEFTYKTVTIKQLKTRWGSCSNTKAINLNLQLMKLPDHLIDYVILHELSHTKHLNHSSLFWNELSRALPNYKSLRKELKDIPAQ